jgi:DNA repair protein RecO (recombination protein O)
MLIKTKGIVLKALKYGESSVIADIYTEQRGLCRYLIAGVRSKKARIPASLLQVISLVEVVAYHRENRDLHRIKSIQSAFVYQAIPFDVRKSAVALFMAEVLRKTIRETEENTELFAFLLHTFQYLDTTQQPIANIHLHFLLQLSVYLGFLPGGDWDAHTPFFDLSEGVFVASLPGHAHYLDEPTSQLLYALLQVECSHCHEVHMTANQRRVLLHHLLDYYKLHIDYLKDIQSHEVLHEVLHE